MKLTLALSGTLALGLAVSSFAQQSPDANKPDQPSKKIVEAWFRPDGKLVVTNPTDKTVKIWDAQTGKPLSPVGTWQLASYKYGDSDKWSDAPHEQKRLKLITATYFTWIAYESASGKVLSTAGGPYTLSGLNYVETIEYAGEGMTDYVGKKQSFTIQLEADKLHQSGKLSDGTKIEEVWERVK
jgi:WD40 repeat protein